MHLKFTRLRLVFLALLFVAAGAGGAEAGQNEDELKSSLPLRLVADIPLNGGATRFDYQSYDHERHLLFIAHLGDGVLTVFDTRSQKVVADIPTVSKVHGVLAIPALGRVYASATGTNEVVAIDEESFRVVATMSGGTFPDGIAYAPVVHKLYVSDLRGEAVVVIDTESNRQIATIALGGKAGNTQYDPVSKHIFVNAQTLSELVEIDPDSDKVTARYPLPGADHNHGLLIDPTRRLAFVACEGNAKLLVIDMKTMKVVSTHTVGEAPDMLAFDPELGLLYVASEFGVVSIFRIEESEVKKVGEGVVAETAHSVVVDPETHRVYFPLQNVDGRPVLRVMAPDL